VNDVSSDGVVEPAAHFQQTLLAVHVEIAAVTAYTFIHSHTALTPQFTATLLRFVPVIFPTACIHTVTSSQ
jgi:hypothetical protein